jgi:hypothetical protein
MFGRLEKIAKLWFVALCALLLPVPAAASVAPLVFFPLQDLSQGTSGINIPFTEYLADRLEESGVEIYSLETVISFMANNRIRSSGQLDTYYINKVRDELGAAFVLFGTVIQNSEIPRMVVGARGRLARTHDASLGLTLTLVRTYDARTVWTYVGASSSADLRKLLDIGKITSVMELQRVLGDEILSRWPGNIVRQEQQNIVSIGSIVLQPDRVLPGAEIHCRVSLRNTWTPGRAPRAFFKADEQIYAASFSVDGNEYEASWIAGEKDGRFPVSLILEWPYYGRTETIQLGDYLVDGVPPLISLSLRDEAMQGERPIFSDEVVFVPQMLVHKPIARWDLTIRNKDDLEVASQLGNGVPPETLVWGRRNFIEGLETEGVYQAIMQVWDLAGNQARATAEFELNSKLPKVAVSAGKEGRKVTIDLKRDSKADVAYWRLEIWSEAGKILKIAEGKELPAQIGLELPTGEEDRKIEGLLVVEDILGNKAQQQIKDLLRTAGAKKEKVIVEEKTETKAWVNEF